MNARQALDDGNGLRGAETCGGAYSDLLPQHRDCQKLWSKIRFVLLFWGEMKSVFMRTFVRRRAQDKVKGVMVPVLQVIFYIK